MPTRPSTPARVPRRRRPTIALGCALLALAVLGASASGAEALTWKIKGAGFGHGIGLSQYGAYGYAKHGWGYKKIVLHYYRGTRIGKTELEQGPRPAAPLPVERAASPAPAPPAA